MSDYQVHSYIVKYVKDAAQNNEGKMRQGVVILTNVGDKWINLTRPPFLTMADKGKSIKFSITIFKGKLYGSVASNMPTDLPQEVPQGQQAAPQPPQTPKAPQSDRLDQERTTRLSIERQTAIKAACELFAQMPDTPDKNVLEFARKAAYFISTGLNLADKKQIDRKEKLAAAELADEQPIYREPGEDEPPSSDGTPY